MKYTLEMDSFANDTHTKVHKNWFRHSDVDGGGDLQTHREHGDLISVLSLFCYGIRKVRYKCYSTECLL
jgi:hypothetical protein